MSAGGTERVLVEYIILFLAVTLWAKADLCEEGVYQNTNGSSRVNVTLECNTTHFLVAVNIDAERPFYLYKYYFGIECRDLNNSRPERLVLAEGVYLESEFATIEAIHEVQYGWECVLFGCYDEFGLKLMTFATDQDHCTVDEDECLHGHNCSEWAICTNVIGSYNCSCWLGYEGDGFICTDIDECVANSTICGLNSICANLAGSFNCSCKKGYTLVHDKCVDINECDRGIHECSGGNVCYNHPGGYNCTCIAGFHGDGWNCTKSSGVPRASDVPLPTAAVVLLALALVFVLLCVTALLITGVLLGSRKKRLQLIYRYAFMTEWRKQELDKDHNPVDPQPSITPCRSLISIIETLQFQNGNEDSLRSTENGSNLKASLSSSLPCLMEKKRNHNQYCERLSRSPAPTSGAPSFAEAPSLLIKDESGFVSDTSSTHYLSFHELSLQYY